MLQKASWLCRPWQGLAGGRTKVGEAFMWQQAEAQRALCVAHIHQVRSQHLSTSGVLSWGGVLGANAAATAGRGTSLKAA